MSSKTRARLHRMLLNVWPCLVGTGGYVTHLADDYTELTVRLALNWRTRNAVGTIFGGSMYASTDPYFMLMLMRLLGKRYVVWDKGCTLRFKRPAKGVIYAHFRITPEMLEDVRSDVRDHGESEFTWTVRYQDEAGTVYAEFDKVLYVADKVFYANKQRARAQRAAAA